MDAERRRILMMEMVELMCLLDSQPVRARGKAIALSVWESAPCEAWSEYQPVHHDPAPKKIPFKQGPRQSFRQSMRSVNRNR